MKTFQGKSPTMRGYRSSLNAYLYRVKSGCKLEPRHSDKGGNCDLLLGFGPAHEVTWNRVWSIAEQGPLQRLAVKQEVTDDISH